VAQIGRQGLHAISIDEARDSEVAAKKAAAMQAANAGPARGHVSRRTVEAFTREIANLLAAGIPLSRALALLRREARNPAAKQLWSDIHDDVVGGTSLHESLAKYPKSFSSVYVAMVQAGETGGFLDTVLGQISDFRAREADLKGKVKAAMIYPLILATVATGVVIFLLTFFIPKFQGIFAQFGADLPVLTQFIIGVSNVIKHFGLWVLGGGAVLFFIFYKSIATENGRRAYEKAILSTPLVGKVVAHFALVRFARMLGTLVGSGVPLIASLRVARQAIGNQTLSDTVSRAIEEVQRGQPLSKSLAESPLLFPASVVEMIAVAEETGRLDKELLRMAVSYESDLDRQLRMLVAVAEPLMLFVMAAIIGTIVIGVLLPLLNLGDVIH
jgi:type II secretory pathway component PulF